VAATLGELLQESSEPLGVICRSQPLAEAAFAAAPSRSKRKRCEIVVCDVYSTAASPVLPFAHTRSQASAVEVGAIIGRMLAQQARGETAAIKHNTLPAVLEPPANT
jgi:hypothetical protein